MGFDVHWTVISIPFVILGGVAVFYMLRRHKEKSSTDHVLKL
jgi:hypothetical protein